MKTKLFALLTCFVAFTSCKNDEKKADAPAEAKAPVKENFNVELDVTAQTMDNFALYYTENNTNDFVPTQVVWKGVNGGGKPETIVMDLPEEVIPTNIRIDFGIKPERKDVVLKKVKIAFYDKTFEIAGSDFLKFFLPNAGVNTTVDAAQGTITFSKKPESKEDSYYYPSQELLDQIAKMTK